MELISHTWIGWDWHGEWVISIWDRWDGWGLGMDIGCASFKPVVTHFVYDTHLEGNS